MKLIIERIVSGGQTGADRAALDVAIAHGLPYCGWCPKGRRALDGVILVDVGGPTASLFPWSEMFIPRFRSPGDQWRRVPPAGLPKPISYR